MYRLLRVVLIAVVAVAAVGLTAMPARALVVDSLTITGVSDGGTNCAQITSVTALFTRTPDTDDGGGEDGYYITVYDAYGQPLVSDDLSATVAGGTRTFDQVVNDYRKIGAKAPSFSCGDEAPPRWQTNICRIRWPPVV